MEYRTSYSVCIENSKSYIIGNLRYLSRDIRWRHTELSEKSTHMI